MVHGELLADKLVERIPFWRFLQYFRTLFSTAETSILGSAECGSSSH
jgi:hypothetical protein